MSIQAARLGHPTRDGLGEIEPHEYELAWADRERVSLEVETEESLADVIARAAASLGVNPLLLDGERFEFQFVAFGGEHLIPLRNRVTDKLTVVDAEGAAIWRVYDFVDITYEQIKRSTEAGTIPGDPSKLFVVRAWPWAGGGVFEDWQSILVALLVIERIVAGIANMYGASQAIRAVLERARQRRAAIGAHQARWMRRGGTPSALKEDLRNQEEWSSRDVAALWGCTVTEAEDTLCTLGYYPRYPGGLWTEATHDGPEGSRFDSADELIAEITSAVRTRFVDWDAPIPEKEVEQIVRQALRRFDR